MPSWSILALSALALAQSVTGAIWSGPTETPCVGKADLAINGFSPKPTEAPGSRSLLEQQNELFKRAVASPRTCGFVSDSIASTSYAITCDYGTCGYWGTSGSYNQGCCFSGYSNCYVSTTCYDYKQYQSSTCVGACALNSFNLVCSLAGSAYCQTYTYPGKGAVGYGCDTDSESTTTTVRSSYVFGGTALGSSYVPYPVTTYSAVLPVIPFLAVSSSSSYSYASSFPSSYPTPNYAYGSGLATGALVIVIIVAIAWAGGYICALVFLILVCRRHKRNIAAIDQQNAARAAGMSAMAGGIPLHASNVVPPGAVYQPYYGGGHVSYYGAGTGGKDVSPPIAQAYPVAATTTPPPQTVSPQSHTVSTPAQEMYTPPAQPAQAYAYEPPAGPPGPRHEML